MVKHRLKICPIRREDTMSRTSINQRPINFLAIGLARLATHDIVTHLIRGWLHQEVTNIHKFARRMITLQLRADGENARITHAFEILFGRIHCRIWRWERIATGKQSARLARRRSLSYQWRSDEQLPMIHWRRGIYTSHSRRYSQTIAMTWLLLIRSIAISFRRRWSLVSMFAGQGWGNECSHDTLRRNSSTGTGMNYFWWTWPTPLLTWMWTKRDFVVRLQWWNEG